MKVQKLKVSSEEGIKFHLKKRWRVELRFSEKVNLSKLLNLINEKKQKAELLSQNDSNEIILEIAPNLRLLKEVLRSILQERQAYPLVHFTYFKTVRVDFPKP